MIDELQEEYLRESPVKARCEMVEEVMDAFDFDRVHRVMIQEGLTCGGGEGHEPAVPSYYKMVKTCEGMLNDVHNHHKLDDGYHTVGVGGFHAECRKDGALRLWFELTTSETSAYADDGKPETVK